MQNVILSIKHLKYCKNLKYFVGINFMWYVVSQDMFSASLFQEIRSWSWRAEQKGGGRAGASRCGEEREVWTGEEGAISVEVLMLIVILGSGQYILSTFVQCIFCNGIIIFRSCRTVQQKQDPLANPKENEQCTFEDIIGAENGAIISISLLTSTISGMIKKYQEPGSTLKGLENHRATHQNERPSAMSPDVQRLPKEIRFVQPHGNSQQWEALQVPPAWVFKSLLATDCFEQTQAYPSKCHERNCGKDFKTR